METQRLKINVEKCYIDKAIDSETITKVLANGQANTTHQLYMMINELKSLQYFLELTHSDFAVSAYIKTQYGYCGAAKRQASVISFMKEHVKQRPKFELKYRFYTKVGNKELFSFNHETTCKNQIYKLIDRLEQKTEELCKTNMS